MPEGRQIQEEEIMNIFTFWEGPMPAYIDLCIRTWKQPYTVLNYENLHNYTDLPIDKIKRFSLPQIADCVRVHVLRDQGGYWLDADTIMVTGELPDTDMVGDPETRMNTIGLLYSEPHSKMFELWADYQDLIINSTGFRGGSYHWSLLGNSFTDEYVKTHRDIRIYPVRDYWPETYMVEENMTRFNKYVRFYFDEDKQLQDIRPTDLLMLHNSWTPLWFKDFTAEEALYNGCTLSNILREVV